MSTRLVVKNMTISRVFHECQSVVYLLFLISLFLIPLFFQYNERVLAGH